uniref:WSC domain-containing protein 1-like n=1 Tax=Styela clava TaxID=7725 RepID=UPI00193A5272|nr:WSC domain-containing protein 1-like [Styela clava]
MKPEIWLVFSIQLLIVRAEDSPTWLNIAETMMPLNVKNRCNVQDIGCFMLIPTYPKTNLKYPITHERCLHKCYMEYTKYSGLINNQCYCGRTLDKFVSNSTCNTDCSIELANNCKSDGSIHIYKLDIYTESCGDGFKSNILESSRIGCLEMPYNLHNHSSVWYMTGMTGQQCVLQCEMFKYTIAIPVLRYSACICSYIFTTFEHAEDVIASKILCNDKNLISGQLVPLYKTSSWDNQCTHRKFLYNYPADKMISVTGFAGSGTTWLRHLIEVVTGYYTGNHGEEHGAYEDGMIGEKMPVSAGRTAVNYAMFRNFIYRVDITYERIILIIRDPYHALKSAYASVVMGSRKASLHSVYYTEDNFHTFVMEEILHWQILPMVLLEKAKEKPVLLIYFEDLINDTMRQVRRIAEFLPQNLTGNSDRLEKRLICTAIEIQGNFKRSEKYKTDTDPFDYKTKRVINESVKAVDDFLKEKNFQALPLSYYRKKKSVWTYPSN